LDHAANEHVHAPKCFVNADFFEVEQVFCDDAFGRVVGNFQGDEVVEHFADVFGFVRDGVAREGYGAVVVDVGAGDFALDGARVFAIDEYGDFFGWEGFVCFAFGGDDEFFFSAFVEVDEVSFSELVFVKPFFWE